MIVRWMRWMFGYTAFRVEGKFPERFLNLAARRGLNLWKLHGKEQEITGCARTVDLPELQQTAARTQNRLHIIRGHGLPHLFRQYRHRCGLLVGALIFAVFCRVMSCFVWSIHIDLPDMINEYELRQLLREQGFAEGARISDLDIDYLINRTAILDNRISWMTINLTGTNAEIRVSPNLAKNLVRKDESRVSNLISSADGTVTSVKVRNGTAMVKAGEGIRKNQLLVSAVMEYNDGTTMIVDSDAQILAKTSRSVRLSIPDTVIRYQPTGKTVEKSELVFCGAAFPLSLQSTPEGLYDSRLVSRQLTLLGNTIPVYCRTRIYREYTKTPVTVGQQQAERILQNRLSLYEVFMLSEASESRILQKNTKVTKGTDGYTLRTNYEIEEDVCQRTVLELEEPEELTEEESSEQRQE